MPNPEILILKLADSTELLASVTEKPGAFFCTDILQIISSVDQETGQGRMGLIDFMPYADPSGGIAVPTGMAIIAIPSQELIEHYSVRFSKIISPNSKLTLV